MINFAHKMKIEDTFFLYHLNIFLFLFSITHNIILSHQILSFATIQFTVRLPNELPRPHLDSSILIHLSAFRLSHPDLDRRPRTANASQEHQRTLRTIQHIVIICISGMRPGPIRIEMCRILPLLTHLHASPVSHFSFVDHLASSVSVAIQCLPDRRNPA
jgi:hypothetical protein